MYLVAPAGEVAEGLDGHAHVGLEGQRVDGPGVHGLYGGQLLLVLLHQVRQPGKGGQGVRVEVGTYGGLCVYIQIFSTSIITHFKLKK